MTESVRPAGTDDSRFLAEVMYGSMLPGVGRGIFDLALEGTGVDPIGFCEALLLEGASNWGQIEDFLVLEDGGERLGALSAFLSDKPDLRPLTGEGFERVSQRLAWEPDVARAFWRAYVGVFGMFGNSRLLRQPAQYVLEYLMIEPRHRGRGLAPMLLRAHADRARSLGFSTIGLAVMYGNEPALRSYQNFGFTEAFRIGPEQYRGAFPGMIRMTLDL